MTDFWKAGEDVHDRVKKLIGQNHPDLALVADEIIVVFKDKAGKSGGKVQLGKTQKVAALANALNATSYKFLIELAADQWEHELDSVKQEALLDHLLCSCRAEEDPKTGEPKCYVAPPDIAAYRDNVERYGMWFPKDEDEEESPVEKMFKED